MFKRPVLWGTSLLFILVSFAPLIFAALVIRYYSVNESTTALHNRLINSSEQTNILLNKYISKDVLKTSRLLAENIQAIDQRHINANDREFFIKRWLLGSTFDGITISVSSENKHTIVKPGLIRKSIKEAHSFACILADSLLFKKAFFENRFFLKKFNGDSIPYLFSFVPLKKTRKNTGFLIAFTQLNELHRMLKKLALDKALSIYLTDIEGNPICKALNFDLKNNHWKIIKKYIRYKMNEDDGKEAVKFYKETEQGQAYIYFLHLNKLLNTYVVIESPAATFTSITQHIYPEFIIIFLLTLILAIFGNYYTYTRITKPVKRLTNAAARVTSGDFDVKVKETHQNEVGNLTRVFNKLVGQIRTFNQINIDKIIIERKKLEHIIEQMAAGILIVDPENNILICNKILAGWYGLDAKTIIGKKLSGIEAFKVFFEMIEKLNWERSSDIKRQTIFLTSDNSQKQKVLDVSASNIFTSGKTFLATSIYVKDITKEYEIDKLKSELISAVAHELRSPMVSIIGFSEMLLGELAEDSPDKEYLEIIHSESNRLASFVDHFLDLTRIESGSFPLNLKDTDFSQVVSRVTSLYETQARTKKIRINKQFSVTVPVLKLDVDLIERAVGNYLANAIKYSPEGSEIIIRIFQKNKQIVLEVKDNGFGISEEHVHRIFDKFYRISSQDEKQTKGSGLGLAFVKQVVEKHNGTVFVKSVKGEGSIFGFTLPLE